MADAKSDSRSQTGSALYLRDDELRQGVGLTFLAWSDNRAGTQRLQGFLASLVGDHKTKGTPS
jgi:hypothetical protein